MQIQVAQQKALVCVQKDQKAFATFFAEAPMLHGAGIFTNMETLKMNQMRVNIPYMTHMGLISAESLHAFCGQLISGSNFFWFCPHEQRVFPTRDVNCHPIQDFERRQLYFYPKTSTTVLFTIDMAILEDISHFQTQQ